jgi:16S rRNA U516 pseudouridylate synthase RsuA-like enzyme
MKHTNGENINISAALLNKKFTEMSSKEDKKEEKYVVDVIKLAGKQMIS